MKFRQFVTRHAAALSMTPVQAIELTKILGNDHDVGSAYAASGVGPGSGPDATPYNVALFLTAVLAGGPQTRAAGEVQRAYALGIPGTNAADDTADTVEAGYDPQAEYDAMPRCAVTRQGVFGDALFHILTGRDTTAPIHSVEFRRGADAAYIVAVGGHRTPFMDHTTEERLRAAGHRGDLAVVASIGGELLAEMASDLAGE